MAVPLADVACIITGPETHWGADVVAESSRFDIPIITCDWRGIPVACTYPWSKSSRVGARHIAQAKLTAPRQKNAWKQIVRAKILGQANNLRQSHSKESASLRKLAMSVRSGDPDNLEARAARTYWSRLLPNEEFSRSRDGGGRNDLLNYGYAVLRGIVVRSIVISGMSPTLGIWHRNRANAFALADDLIEPFRPAVDFAVASLSADSTLADRATKQVLIEATSQAMTVSGVTVATSILELAQSYARYVEGQLPVLPVPAWKPAHG
jgi:CRISPR-associated protein Cas1